MFAGSRAVPWQASAVAAAALAMGAGADSSRADVCVAGPLHLKVDGTPPVATTIPMTIHADSCTPGVTYDGRLFGSVRVGGRHYRVHSLTFTDVGTTSRAVTIRMPARNVRAARAYATRRHLRYAYLYLTARTVQHATHAFPNGSTYKIRLVASAGGRSSQ